MNPKHATCSFARKAPYDSGRASTPFCACISTINRAEHFLSQLRHNLYRSSELRAETVGSWRAAFRLRACLGTMNRNRPNVGQASRLPTERDARTSVPSALPTEAGGTPALLCGSWKAHEVAGNRRAVLARNCM